MIDKKHSFFHSDFKDDEFRKVIALSNVHEGYLQLSLNLNATDVQKIIQELKVHREQAKDLKELGKSTKTFST